MNEAKAAQRLFQMQLLRFMNDEMTQVEVWRAASFIIPLASHVAAAVLMQAAILISEVRLTV